MNATKSWLVVKEESLQSARRVFAGSDVQITTVGRPYLDAALGSTRKHLHHTIEPPPGTSIMEQDTEDVFASTDQQTNENDQLADSNERAENRPSQTQHSEQTVTRAGRVSKPPSQLEDFVRH